MVIFFFVVGLEIKREIISGELASARKAALPIAAAIGGMVVPALIYVALNAGGPGMPGWGIPMATDIAFTLGILVVLGSASAAFAQGVLYRAGHRRRSGRDPGHRPLLYRRHFLDGPGDWGAVPGRADRSEPRPRLCTRPYVVLGIGLWLAFLESGMHPTIAGVLLALTIPTRSPANLRAMLAQTVTLLNSFELPLAWRETMTAGARPRSACWTRSSTACCRRRSDWNTS